MKTKQWVPIMMPLLIIAGCGEDGVSPEEIISQAINENNDLEDYYMETSISMYAEDELVEEMGAKEWFFWTNNTLETRREMTRNEEETHYIVSDGEYSFSYTPGDEEAIRTEILQQEEQPSEMEQQLEMIESYRDTHDIEYIGEETISEREAYHLQFTTSDDEAVNEDMDVWIDQETWAVLQQHSNQGDLRMETTVHELDPSPDYDEELFELDLPDDVNVVHREDEADEFETDVQQLSVEEAEEKLEQPFLMIDETEGAMELEDITFTTTEYTDFTEESLELNYVTEGRPAVTVNVSEIDEEQTNDEDVELPGREEQTIRGNDGHSTEGENFRYVIWQEEGLSYTIHNEDPQLEIEDLVEIAEDMISSEDQ